MIWINEYVIFVLLFIPVQADTSCCKYAY